MFLKPISCEVSVLSLILLLWTTGCTPDTSKKRKVPLISDSIESITLSLAEDSLVQYHLSIEEIEGFAEIWNNSSSPGLLKAKPELVLVVKQKNDHDRRFRAGKDWIKEHGGIAYSIQNPDLWLTALATYEFPSVYLVDYTPLLFLEQWTNKYKDDQELNMISIFPEIPEDWITPQHIDSLILMLDSREKMGFLLNPFSSSIPEGYSEKGGIVALFILAYKDKKEILFNSPAAFPKVDDELNRELILWWEKQK